MKNLEKELFDTVYQWGRVGIVTDEKCETFQGLIKALQNQTLDDARHGGT
jgi:hypothetical protein